MESVVACWCVDSLDTKQPPSRLAVGAASSVGAPEARLEMVVTTTEASSPAEWERHAVSAGAAPFSTIVHTAGGGAAGLVVGGMRDGSVNIWDAQRILTPTDDIPPLVSSVRKHSGPIWSMGVCPVSPMILASGSNNSEIYVWDMSRPDQNLIPGAGAANATGITGLAWNQEVAHILASTDAAEQTRIWDLRASKATFQCKDANNMIPCSAVCWNPAQATQLLVGSSDDGAPVVQLWDLRMAGQPVDQVAFCLEPKSTLYGHQGGIVGITCFTTGTALQILTASKDGTCKLADFSGADIQLVDRVSSAEPLASLSFCNGRAVVAGAGRVYIDDLAVAAVPDANTHLKVLNLGGRAIQELSASRGYGSAELGQAEALDGILTAPDDEVLEERLHVFSAMKVAEPGLPEADRDEWRFLHALGVAHPREVLLKLLSIDPKSIKNRMAAFAKGDSALAPQSVSAPKLSEEAESVLCSALTAGAVGEAAQLCASAGQYAMALSLAAAAGPELFTHFRDQFLGNSASRLNQTVSSILRRNWPATIRESSLTEWKSLMGCFLSYSAIEDEFVDNCSALGKRLLGEELGIYKREAILCYICAGCYDEVVAIWTSLREDDDSPVILQGIVQKAIFMRKIVGLRRKNRSFDSSIFDGPFATLIGEYCDSLVAAGQTKLAKVARSLVEEEDSDEEESDDDGDGEDDDESEDDEDEAPPQARQARQVAHPAPASGAASSPRPARGPSQHQRSTTQPPPSPARPSMQTAPPAGAPGQAAPAGPPTTGYPSPQRAVSTPAYSTGPPTTTSFGAMSGAGGTPTRPQALSASKSWNDPPPMSSYSRNRTKKNVYIAPAITNPMSAPTQPQAAQPETSVTQASPYTENAAAPQHPGPEAVQPAQQPKQQPPAQDENLAPPMPDQYSAMVDILVNIVNACVVKNNPTYKRKLDDVKKRMDVLYSRLAHNQIDPTFVAGLGDLAQGLQARDYAQATSCYKRLITVNPEETGAFMIGIKTLIHVARSLPI